MIDVYAYLYWLMLLYVISVIVILLLDNRDPDKTITWIIVFALLPFVGIFFYFYLGQNWKKKHFIRNFYTRSFHLAFQKQVAKLTTAVKLDTSFQNKVAAFIEQTSFFHVCDQNTIKHLPDGKEKYSTLLKELKKAKEYIHIEYYIFKPDYIGQEIKEVLIKKAKQGIEVKFLYDFWGSFSITRKMVRELKRSGVQVQSFFNPFKIFAHHKMNYRNHRKMVVIDGETAFIGGMNVGKEYVHEGSYNIWKDYHMMVKGEAVKQIQLVMLYDWYLTTKKNTIKQEYFKKTKVSSKQRTQVMYSGPESKWETIRQVYLLMITNAKKSIKITTPYFIPDESLSLALKNAALSGVKVELILPGFANILLHKVLFRASQTYYEELLTAGVKIYQFKKGFVHAKILSVDKEISTVGTANLDIRSLKSNFEVNLMCYDKKDIDLHDNYIESLKKESVEINLVSFKKRSLFSKVKESVARLLSPLL